jgi:LDH2 family malate/lactate/ureidoglycolate dehydrogenase
MKTKGTKPTASQPADELARYIKELKARAKLGKVMKRLEDIRKHAKENQVRLPGETRAKQRNTMTK